MEEAPPLPNSSPAAHAAASSSLSEPPPQQRNSFRRHEIWTYFGPAFVASVAYIDPGNFATNILGGSQFGYRLLWVLLWSNAMAILIQYLSAKLGIVTGRTLPQNCREHFRRPTGLGALGRCRDRRHRHRPGRVPRGRARARSARRPLAAGARPLATQSLFAAALVSTVLVFGILALDLAGFQWLERGIMALVGIIGLCYGFEVFLVHPDWQAAASPTLIPTLDPHASKDSLYAAVGMLGATVMPHVVYLHSALVQPRLQQLARPPQAPGRRRAPALSPLRAHRRLCRHERRLADQLRHDRHGGRGLARTGLAAPSIQDAYRTLGPLLRPSAAIVFAVALLCSGLSIVDGRCHGRAGHHRGLPRHQVPHLSSPPDHHPAGASVIAIGLDPLRILILSQVVLSFTLPAALIPLLLLTNRDRRHA